MDTTYRTTSANIFLTNGFFPLIYSNLLNETVHWLNVATAFA